MILTVTGIGAKRIPKDQEDSSADSMCHELSWKDQSMEKDIKTGKAPSSQTAGHTDGLERTAGADAEHMEHWVKTGESG